MADDANDQTEETVKCNSCGRSTRHNLTARYPTSVPIFDDDDTKVGQLEQVWELWQCRGCNTVTVRSTTHVISEAESTGVLRDTRDYVEFFPPRTGSYHTTKAYQTLPRRLRDIYKEVVDTLNRRSFLLCAAGLRALLEGICEDKGIVEGPNQHGKIVKSLEGRINGLTKFVPQNIVGNLHGLRFLGNQALHLLEMPRQTDLELALSVIEDILNVVYDLDYRSRLLHRMFISSEPDDDDLLPF